MISALRLRSSAESGSSIIRRRRLGEQGAADRDALALAARQARRPAIEQCAEVEEPDHPFERQLGSGGRRAALGIAQIAAHREVREQAGILEHVADAATVRRQEDAPPVVLPDLAVERQMTAAWPLQARDHPEQRALAVTRGAEEPGDALERQAGVDRQAEARKLHVALDLEARHPG